VRLAPQCSQAQSAETTSHCALAATAFRAASASPGATAAPPASPPAARAAGATLQQSAEHFAAKKPQSIARLPRRVSRS